MKRMVRSRASLSVNCSGGDFMKSPPEQFTDNEARERTIRFIGGDED